MQSLTVAPLALPTEFVELIERAGAYVDAATANNTRRAYDAAWRAFETWCQSNGLDPLPALPSTVGLYLTSAADEVKVSTLRLRLAAIARRHRDNDLSLDTGHPAIRKIMQGVARTKGSAPKKKEAATDVILRDAIRAYASGDAAKAKRDKAILTVGFFAALRRSELAAIDIEHVTFTDEGALITLPRRKTDQEGHGTVIGLPHKDDVITCPVAALKAWMESVQSTSGPLFRSVSRGGRVLTNRIGDRDVARIVKDATGAAGYDADTFGGHSLRAGFITTCARKGVPERIIATQSGHKSINVLRGYVRRASIFKENAAAMI